TLFPCQLGIGHYATTSAFIRWAGASWPMIPRRELPMPTQPRLARCSTTEGSTSPTARSYPLPSAPIPLPPFLRSRKEWPSRSPAFSLMPAWVSGRNDGHPPKNCRGYSLRQQTDTADTAVWHVRQVV